ncbi:putative bifunctional diguanylate cyclase/phosphodiesterase [Mangrovitalea sediminis]|uniref:putative bifunctional diguanylate cyclase/phosphodiesterase n=1 Tax=Mangrovitalea sediminis TaxID=1982043 RepID=UPI000BE606CA|nr:EAL domain-containing protein [Mangrovitalea sediminis]
MTKIEGSPRHIRLFLGRFVLYFLIASVLSVWIALWFDYQRQNHQAEKILTQERAQLDAEAAGVVSNLNAGVAHMKILMQTPAFRNYAFSQTPGHREDLAQLFGVFIDNVDFYNDIRLVDNRGHELIRVNRSRGHAQTQIVPAEKLRRSVHLSETEQRLPDGDVYLSSLESDSDREDMASSVTPTLRLSSPVSGREGVRVGFLQMNLRNERLFDGFSHSAPLVSGREFIIVERNGRWVLRRLPGKGGMVQWHRLPQPDVLFNGAWSRIQSMDEGVIETASSAFVVDTLFPARDTSVASNRSTGTLQSVDDAWKLVARIPSEWVHVSPWTLLWNDRVYVGGMLVLVALISAILAWFRAVVLIHVHATRESEAQLRTVLDNTMALAYLKDRDGHYLFVNRRMAEMIGQPADELTGKSDRDVFSPEFAETYRQNDLSVLNSGQPQEFEEVVPSEDGDRIFISVKFPLQQSGDGQAVCGISTDITERKQIEAELRQAAVVFESTNEGIIVTDADMRIIAVNKAYTTITGYSADEVMGKAPRFQKSGIHDEAFYRRLWDDLKSAGQWQGEIWDRHKSGEVIPLWENISVVHASDGRVSNYVAVLSDISAIKQAEARLNYLAHHDSLTGLPNRLLFYANLDQVLIEAERHPARVAVMLLDLDRFKLVNDTLGHPAGDRLLQIVSERLRACVRAEDTVARLGGDEFAVILRDVAHTEDVIRIAEKIISAVDKPVLIDHQTVNVGVSIGISLFPDDADSSDALTMTADSAMYRAKERGRRTFEFYSSEMTARASSLLKLETELREGIRRNEFVLYYQPQFDVRTGRMVGAEGLIRWRHPSRGLLLPGQFIPAAEDTGLIHSLGYWVLQEGCRQASAWKDAGISVGPLSLNISASQLTRNNLVGRLHQMLESHGIDANALQLELEVTESVLHVSGQGERVLRELRALGLHIVIDDFGTGYSSLSLLKQLPVDKIKIAGEFMHGLPRDENNAAIATAVISLGHSLSMPVVAEGVETEEQLAFLKEKGCGIAQGFLLSLPLTAEEITERFSRQSNV